MYRNPFTHTTAMTRPVANGYARVIRSFEGHRGAVSAATLLCFVWLASACAGAQGVSEGVERPWEVPPERVEREDPTDGRVLPVAPDSVLAPFERQRPPETVDEHPSR